MIATTRCLLLLLLFPAGTLPFVVFPRTIKVPWAGQSRCSYSKIKTLMASNPPEKQQTIYLEPILNDQRLEQLFAWVCRAFAGDSQYDNLMVTIVAVFGSNVPKDSQPGQMLTEAMVTALPEEELAGAPIPLIQRERASLGAMGAAQWTGQFRTRPHSLLSVTNFTSVDEWVKTLPRGCKRTLKKADAQNFTVKPLSIHGGQPAPHSSLAHFRCVVEHEVRLISSGGNDSEGFFDALFEAVSRYVGTTRMTGEIREYRNQEGKIIAFAHEVRKGRTIRGQWFYASDEAAKSYVWFHSVKDLVRRAVDADLVDVVDLGPSGSDAFSDLKGRYGFASVEDWPAVADYQGPFWYGDDVQETPDDLERNFLMKALDDRESI